MNIEASETMDGRVEIYLEILQHGLGAIRDAAVRGDARVCEIEADHLHNLPSLVDEKNEARHRYYLEQERQLYLDRLKSVPDFKETFALRRFRELWTALEALR
jgi:hypothetical protein